MSAEEPNKDAAQAEQPPAEDAAQAKPAEDAAQAKPAEDAAMVDGKLNRFYEIFRV